MARRRSLLPLVQKFFELDPAAAAHTLETMEDKEAVEVVRALPPDLAAEAFHHLQITHAASFLADLPQALTGEIMGRMDPDQSAALLMHLPHNERADVISMLPERAKERVRELLEYPEDSAGRMMSADFIALRSTMRVREAVPKIRSAARRTSPPSYVYVVDEERHLVGIVNMRDLLLASREDSLEAIMMSDVVSVAPFTDREELANLFSRQHYFAIPVVDAERRMLGIIRSNQALSDVQEEASEDIQKMFGAGGNEHAFSPILFSLGKRLPWLHVNLVTAFLAAGVVGLFEDLIARITILAVFLPVVAGQGGNAGAQSLAVVMRGLVMREIPGNKVWKLISKETLIGLLNGLVIGVVTAGIAWVWNGQAFLGLVIGLAMIANLVAAGFFGALIPISMKRLGFDPSQSSSIVLTTVTDVLGFFAFLGFALLFESLLR